IYSQTGGFVVIPQYKRPARPESVDLITNFIVTYKQHPVFFLEIKASERLRHIGTRKAADLQMRERFEKLFDDV
ncbi:hypothetical protein EV426DRAFT_533220, partial [Tirmania nivea]